MFVPQESYYHTHKKEFCKDDILNCVCMCFPVHHWREFLKYS